MRYSIMLQVVGIITLILVGTAGLFAWLQNRETAPIRSEFNEEINKKLEKSR
ncbi:MAG: hypothetical protein RLZZ04_2931 [Cyanobacteriota bacterium]|jgi:hypothetical protein